MIRVDFLVMVSLALLGTGALADESSLYQRERLARPALEQARRITGDWDPAQRDCAGFVRYVYRRGLNLPANLWRNQKGDWVEYLGAGELVSHNFSLLSRNPAPENLQTGDLLVFYNPHKKPFEAWHLMLVVKSPGTASHQALVVYHNGDVGRRAAVRKVLWENLRTETSSWLPTPENPLFQGAFRWRGWPRIMTREIAITEDPNKESL